MSPNKTSKMLISKEKGLYKNVDATKTSTGSFFTKKEVWLNDPVEKFLIKVLKENNVVLDPYVGDGHLLQVCKQKFNSKIVGFDIRPGDYEINDSLINIPNSNNAVIVTNPPYLAKYSARRKGVINDVEKYFVNGWSDLYLVALEKCLVAARYVVAIIPETFLNSSFSKQYLSVLSVLEDNPFDDTETPVCVACFDTSSFQKSRLYIGNKYCGDYEDIFRYRKTVPRDELIEFNVPTGRIALKAVDGTNEEDKIRFENAENFSYSRENIKVSSRLLTYIEIDSLSDSQINEFVEVANDLLNKLRSATFDLVLSPFKGNNKAGKRRRRLDYTQARLIAFQALQKIKPNNKTQFKLFD